jgi:3-hydroxybutyryl-CoA dehydrogenase
MTAIRRLGVVGAGQMGRGIAQVCAQADIDVFLNDANETALADGLKRIKADLDKLVDRQKLEAGKRDAIVAHLHAAPRLEDVATCDFVVEAAVENVEAKLAIFTELDRRAGPDAILASNTSSISLTKIAGATRRPERVIGMHFMNPVPLMRLVEVVRALQTDDATYKTTCALAEKLGKVLVTTKDMPGFIVNRMLIPFLNEACFALQEGLGTIHDIDQGAKLGLNHPMGPFELADLIGLDTCLYISEVLHNEFGDDKYRPATLLRNYVAAGWLGRKTKKGFYEY